MYLDDVMSQPGIRLHRFQIRHFKSPLYSWTMILLLSLSAFVNLARPKSMTFKAKSSNPNEPPIGKQKSPERTPAHSKPWTKFLGIQSCNEPLHPKTSKRKLSVDSIKARQGVLKSTHQIQYLYTCIYSDTFVDWATHDEGGVLKLTRPNSTLTP